MPEGILSLISTPKWVIRVYMETVVLGIWWLFWIRGLGSVTYLFLLYADLSSDSLVFP